MSTRFIKIHPRDNVLVALTDLNAGQTIQYEGHSFELQNQISAKHKFLLEDLKPEGEVIMYGVVVGKAIVAIPQGGAITTQNVKHKSASFGIDKGTYSWSAPDVSKWSNRTFMGYHRSDGQVGTHNYWLVIPLVFCENRNVDILSDAFGEVLGFAKQDVYKNYVQQLAGMYQAGDISKIEATTIQQGVKESPRRLFPNIDGVRFLNHQGGCGGTRQDSEALCALLAGYINNPNVAGATVLSLGCQNAQASLLKQKLNAIAPNFNKPLIVLEQQKEGTEATLIQKAIQKTFLSLIEANKLERSPAPLSKLVVGLECGGSDGFSGISANPAVGHAADLISALGGSAILSEFPELCGVEQELINRTTTRESAVRFVELMQLYAKAAASSGSGFDMNPSPGNIKDGLITDAMKSAGAAKKGGTSPVADVLDYGEYIRRPGLTLLCTPGNDVESTTAMAGSGANIILFTTGLGTPTGNPVAPVIKISSNTTMARRMPDIIDIDAGSIIEGSKTIEDVGEEMLDYIIEVASGRKTTKASQLQQYDFIPWKRGVSL